MNTAARLKLAAVLAGLGLGAYLLWRASGAAGRAAGAISEAAWAVAPWNNENVFASSVNKLGAGLVADPEGPGKNADGSWTLGGWFHDITNPGTVAAIKALQGPTGATSGYTDAEAAAARAAYAERDPRRIDLPAFIYPKP